jgi:hypothetical protein
MTMIDVDPQQLLRQLVDRAERERQAHRRLLYLGVLCAWLGGFGIGWSAAVFLHNWPH